MKIFIIFTLAIAFSFSVARAEKQKLPTEPCDVSVSLLEPSLKEKISFWGKVLEVKEVDARPQGQEIFFEPKTTHAGPKLKRVKVFMKKINCWLDLKKNQHMTVVFNEDGKGTIFAVKYEGAKERKSEKYPYFEPELGECEGFDARPGFSSADLYVFATPSKIEVDDKEGIRIITFKAKRVWNGPKVDNFKVLQNTDYCDSPFSLGSSYDLILNRADERYYYHDCCGVSGEVGAGYEKLAEEWNKKYLNRKSTIKK